MTLRTYKARTMAQALDEVRRDLGREAVILHTRPFRKGGLFGVGARRFWEVTASTEVNVPPLAARGRYVPVDDENAGTGKPGAPAQPDETVPTEQAGLGTQVTRLQQMISRLLEQAPERGKTLPDGLAELEEHLVSQDVEKDTAREIMDRLGMSLTGEEVCDAVTVRRRVRDLIAERIPIAPPAGKSAAADRPCVIALIGPTGVGKTTTIAKLAANYSLHENKRVGLVTMDTYRIAAVEQLRTYAEIVDVPLRTVLSAGELHKAIHDMRDLDMVLIDTAGRSQNNRMRLNQLRGFLAAAAPDEVHLAISATSNRSCAESTVKRFAPLGANRVLLTKADEAATFGVILSVARCANLKFTYVTTGQDVPDDIAPADARILADWIVEGSIYAD